MQPPASSGNQPAITRAEKTQPWFHWLFVLLLAAAFALVLAENGLSLDLPGRPGWPEALLILLATVGTITALARQLALQNVLLAAFVIALLGGAIHALGVTMGIPFGPFIFGAEAGPQLFKTLPWAMPLIWVVAVLNSRGVVRLILRPWRKIRSYGFWLMGLTAVLTMLFDLAFDPFASRVKHYWLWMPTKFPLTWQGAPLVNFLSWTAVALLMLVLVTPALINKNPARRVPDFHPLGVWVGAILLFGTASALHGMWVAVALDGTIAVLAATFAIRGGRW
ncbi:MAG: carotenoid biosynthesis protein [Verrucomicrobiota bacterium]